MNLQSTIGHCCIRAAVTPRTRKFPPSPLKKKKKKKKKKIRRFLDFAWLDSIDLEYAVGMGLFFKHLCSGTNSAKYGGRGLTLKYDTSIFPISISSASSDGCFENNLSSPIDVPVFFFFFSNTG